MLKQICALALAVTSAFAPTTLQAAWYADSVVAYSPGTGFATDFATSQGLTNALAALGQPSILTPGQFGGPVDPFSPPYLGEQIVSIGAGGSLTVRLSNPILNDPARRFGVDLMIYGNTGFAITNGNFSGGGITDGSLFGANPGTARVSVSADNLTYFELDPTKAPPIDRLFPTDGSGSFDLAVDPSLSNEDFAGLDLKGIRARYDGSAGGTGLDMAWAVDGNGQAVDLTGVQYIRIDVLTGVAEIDGLAAPASVPEPSTWVMLAGGCGLLFGRVLRKAPKPAGGRRNTRCL